MAALPWRCIESGSSPIHLPGLAIDPTVVDPATPALLTRWANSEEVPCPLESKEDRIEKRAHHADTPPAWAFWPCAFCTQMDMGPGALARANHLALLIATRRNGGIPPVQRLLDSVRRDVHGRLGVALMRELGAGRPDQLVLRRQQGNLHIRALHALPQRSWRCEREHLRP